MNKRFLKVAVLLALVLALVTGSAAFAQDVTYDTQKLDANYALALAYIGREDYDKAMEYLDACLKYCDEKSNPDVYADVHLKIACVHTIHQEYDNALKELDEAVRVKADLSEAYLVQTQVYSDLGDYENAAAALQKYIDLTGDNSLYQVKAEIYSAVGNADKALESYKIYAESDSQSQQEATYKTAIYNMENGMYEEAIKEFGSILNNPTYGPSSRYNIGVCYMRQENYEKALDYFKQVKDQDYDGLRYNLGVCNMLLDKIDDAIEAFTASIEKESFVTDALYNRAICYVSQEKFANAIVDFTAYLDNMKAQKVAALNEEAKKDAEAKGTTAQEIKAEDVEDVVDISNYYRGVCYLSVGENESAIADFTACINNNLAVDDSRFNRGLASLQAGQNESARDDFTECIKKNYNKDASQFYRSYALIALGDNEGALADLTACIESEYNLGQTYYQRAQIYMAMGDEEKYVADLEESLKY